VAAHRHQAGLLLRATTASASARLSASGISTCTCLPAFRQAMACAACICVGVHRITASTSFSARLSARSVVTWPMPYLAAVSRVFSSSRLTSETTSTPSISLIASRCLMPKAPAPASATLMVCSCVLQDQVAHGGVRRRHVIEAVRHARCAAASLMAPRAISHITSSMPSEPASRT
jgi:hypothetical protein